MKSKLLNKPFKTFTIYALIILACSIPVYVLVIDYIWINELDEHNSIVKERIAESLIKNPLSEIELRNLNDNWGEILPGTCLVATNRSVIKSDSLYTITKQVFDDNKLEEERFRVLISYLKINGIVYQLNLETNVEEADESFFAIALITLLFFIFLVTGFIILNKRIAKKIWLPFHSTLQKVKNFDLTTRQSIHFEPTEISEFETLNQALTKLIDKNISVYKQQQAFVENASHELQTPMAVLKAKIDLLFQTENISSEQAEIISAIELPLGRMSRINKNLLLLAKIENNQFAETENLQVNDILNETLDLMYDYINDKNITVEMQEKSKITVSCNKTLLEMLISNLLINGIVHNIKNGNIFIACNEDKLIISNTGANALNAEKLFERFAVSSSEKTNSGLGLAIAKEIAHRYHWKLTYAFQSQMHTFAVDFKN